MKGIKNIKAPDLVTRTYIWPHRKDLKDPICISFRLTRIMDHFIIPCEGITKDHYPYQIGRIPFARLGSDLVANTCKAITICAHDRYIEVQGRFKCRKDIHILFVRMENTYEEESK